MLIPFPQELREWLDKLPKEDRLREIEIADRNLLRIQNHMEGK